MKSLSDEKFYEDVVYAARGKQGTVTRFESCAHAGRRPDRRGSDECFPVISVWFVAVFPVTVITRRWFVPASGKCRVKMSRTLRVPFGFKNVNCGLSKIPVYPLRLEWALILGSAAP
jgi:hypothetical protein